MTDGQQLEALGLLHATELAIGDGKTTEAIVYIVNLLKRVIDDKSGEFVNVKPPRYCGYCGAQLSGPRHKKWCDSKCRVYGFRAKAA